MCHFYLCFVCRITTPWHATNKHTNERVCVSVFAFMVTAHKGHARRRRTLNCLALLLRRCYTLQEALRACMFFVYAWMCVCFAVCSCVSSCVYCSRAIRVNKLPETLSLSCSRSSREDDDAPHAALQYTVCIWVCYSCCSHIKESGCNPINRLCYAAMATTRRGVGRWLVGCCCDEGDVSLVTLMVRSFFHVCRCMWVTSYTQTLYSKRCVRCVFDTHTMY